MCHIVKYIKSSQVYLSVYFFNHNMLVKYPRLSVLIHSSQLAKAPAKLISAKDVLPCMRFIRSAYTLSLRKKFYINIYRIHRYVLQKLFRR